MQNSRKKIKSSNIIGRLFSKSATGKMIRMKQHQKHPFPAVSMMKVDHLERIGSSHFIDGDTSHTAKTSFSYDDDDVDCSSMDALGSILSAALHTIQAEEAPKRVIKSVRFAATITSRPILNRRNYTDEMKRQCWYQSDEYDRIHESCRRLVSKYEQCVREEMHFRYCMRGLENQVAANGRFRLLNRQAALEEVFAAQCENPTDADYIADCYRKISSSCQLWAHCVGLKDLKMAQRYHNV